MHVLHLFASCLCSKHAHDTPLPGQVSGLQLVCRRAPSSSSRVMLMAVSVPILPILPPFAISFFSCFISSGVDSVLPVLLLTPLAGSGRLSMSTGCINQIPRCAPRATKGQASLLVAGRLRNERERAYAPLHDPPLDGRPCLRICVPREQHVHFEKWQTLP